MKKGLVLIALLLLSSCEFNFQGWANKANERIKDLVGGKKEVTSEISDLPSLSELDSKNQDDKAKYVVSVATQKEKIEIIPRQNGNEANIVRMTDDSQSINKSSFDPNIMGDTELEKKNKEESFSKKEVTQDSIKKSPFLSSVDVRKILLKGDYRQASEVKVPEDDKKNLYYRAVATYNLARTVDNGEKRKKITLLAEKRFSELARDKENKNLRLRAVLWMGINSYKGLAEDKSTEELLHPFNYLLTNYKDTRYSNDAVFYKMLVYFKKNDKKKAREMWGALSHFSKTDLIYDADNGRWVSNEMAVKHYENLFGNNENKKTIEEQKKPKREIISPIQLENQASVRKVPEVKLETISEDQKASVFGDNKSEPKAVALSDDEAMNKILSDDKVASSGIDSGDEKMLNEAAKKDEATPQPSEVAQADKEATAEKQPVKEESVADTKDNQVKPVNTPEPKLAEEAVKDEKKVAQQTKSIDSNINSVISDMDNIISGY